jgi:hypothetical protein
MSIEENGSRVESSREDHTGTSTFDSAARGLADGSVSRGRALRMLAASLFGGALVAAPAAVAVAAPSDNRKPGGTGCPVAGQIRQGGKCTCPQSTPDVCGTGSNAQCVNRQCGTGSTFNQATCKCEAVNTCGAGEVLCNGNCLQECGGAQVRNPESCACECPGTEELCNGRCVDPTGCSATSTFNPETCKCEAVNQCGTNQVFCNGQCFPECTGGRVRDANCNCTNCPQNETLCNGRCVNNQCGGGRTFNPATCQCECPATAPVLCGGNCVAECTGGNERCPTGCTCGRPIGATCTANNQCCSGTCVTSGPQSGRGCR